MTLVGLAFALVALVWVGLDYRRAMAGRRYDMSVVTDRVFNMEQTLIELRERKPELPDLDVLKKRVATLEAATGLKTLGR